METATLTKPEEAHVERMAESFSQPTTEERFESWASRVISEAKKEKKEEKNYGGPREMKGSSTEEREWIESVGQRDESESPRKSPAEKDASGRAEQRSDVKAGENPSEPTNSPVEPLSGDRHWTAKLEGKELETFQHQVRNRVQIAHTYVNLHPQRAQIEQGLQKLFTGAPQIFRDDFYKALAEVPNPGAVLRHLALKAEDQEVLRSVKNSQELRAAIHTVSHGSPTGGQEQALAEAHANMSEMLRHATAKYPDAAERIKTATNEVMRRAPTFVQSFVNDSRVIGDLLYTLADQTTLNNLLETAKVNPGKAVRVLRDMELDIRQALSRASATRPRAPRPPSEVGGRGAANDDNSTRGLDFTNFSQKMNERYARQAR